MLPSSASHSQSMHRNFSHSNKLHFQNDSNTPASTHSLKRRYAAEQEQMPVQSSAFHCMPVRSTSRIASIAARFGTRGRWHPKGCGFGAGSRGSICSHKASLSRQPSSRIVVFMIVTFVHNTVLLGRRHALMILLSPYRNRLLMALSAVVSLALRSGADKRAFDAISRAPVGHPAGQFPNKRGQTPNLS
jgi:hypothetical protein